MTDYATTGQEVLLRGKPPRLGVVTKVYETAEGTHYVVFTNGQAGLHVAALDATLVPRELERTVVERDEFLRRLLLYKLQHPFSDVLYSYRGTRTTFEVYQFKPVFKYFGSDRRSLLIADEVGLGKTIEAALIYLELKARTDLPRVLIACPSGLREKWRSELKLRFDEDFQVLDVKGINQFLDLYERTAGLYRLRGIVSLEVLRRPEIQQRFVDASFDLDLFVVDEAHHLRNSWTETHKVGRLLADRAENTVLLTATPLQTGTDNLFNLLQLLDPGTFDDFAMFESYLLPNAEVNRAIRVLGQQPPDLASAQGAFMALQRYPWMQDNAVLRRALDLLSTARGPTDEELVRIRRDLLELNSLAFLFTRTKKKDVASTAIRQAQTVRVQLSPAERVFYEAMLDYVRREIVARAGAFAAFAMVTRERQAASCLVATRKYLEETLKTRSSQIQYEDASLELDEEPDEVPGARSLAELKALLELSRAIGGIDSKRDALLQLLERIQENASSQKVLVFSFFRRTLEYLRAELTAAGYTIFTIHGGVPPGERQRVMEQFRAADGPAILLSSEVGAEGLDFQFCDTLVNYDLPWNPMKVEQRIGRIDRYGQMSPKIMIFNLLLDDTIETRILERLYARIRIFEEAIGDLEPIIGPEVQQLTTDVMSKDLTPAQQEALVHQTALRVENRRQLDEEFERQRAQLMAQDSLFLSEVNDAVREGRVVSAPEVAAMVGEWLRAEFPTSSLRALGDGSWHFMPDPSLTVRYQQFLAGMPDKSRRDVDLLQKMTGKLGVPCTFDADLASQRRALEFFHVRHGLVQMAVGHFRKSEADRVPALEWLVSRLRVEADDLPTGVYSFFLYAVHVEAVNAQLTFVPIVVDAEGNPVPSVASRLLALVQGNSDRAEFQVDWERQQVLRDQQGELIAHERTRIQKVAEERNAALVEVRLSSVQRSFDAKIRKRQEWLLEARDDRIRRMREAEIANLRRQAAERLEGLNAKRQVMVTYELVAEGVLDLVGAPEEDHPATPPPGRRDLRPLPKNEPEPVEEAPAHAEAAATELPPARAVARTRSRSTVSRKAAAVPSSTPGVRRRGHVVSSPAAAAMPSASTPHSAPVAQGDSGVSRAAPASPEALASHEAGSVQHDPETPSAAVVQSGEEGRGLIGRLRRRLGL